jgi:phenylalanyl-tRNA synthetase beta chain
MKLSYNWLKEFVPIDVTPQTLAEQLTLKSAVVEEVKLLGQDLQKVVVGEILEIRPHPKSTKLQLAKVSIGKDTPEIVCGAKNIRVGQKVPVALLGAKLPGGVEIKPREIRGVTSEGMLCSAKELAISQDHEGILVLPDSLTVGSDVRAVLGLDDAIFDLTVLPDRSYLLSHIGAARDIATIRRQTLVLSDYGRAGADAITGSSIKNSGTVSIVEPSLCSRYSLILLSNLTIKPSPPWLATRLQALGVRPVNNLVDLTNYVMLELGQPLHAFDLAKLQSHRITVRRAKKGEQMVTIDGVERTLDPDMLVITDHAKPIAVAGVMGGKESEITNLTSGALIESANFDARSIRITSQKLKIRSEASMRYERGVDPSLTAVALARLVELMPRAGLVDARPSQVLDVNPSPLTRQPIRFVPTMVKKITGVDVPLSEQIRILQDLGMAVDDKNLQTDNELHVTPPSFRADVTIAQDLVEEVIRIYGLDRVPLTLPEAKLIPQPFATDRHWSRKIKNLLRGASFTEVETYSFSSSEVLSKMQIDLSEHITLQNPMTPEQRVLRSSLVPNMLQVVRRNIANGVTDMRFFELGRTFRFVRGKPYPYEPHMLCAVEVSAHGRSAASKAAQGADYAPEWRHLAQLLEAMLFHFGLDIATLKRKPFTANPSFHHGRTALLEIEGEEIGFLAEVHPLVLSELDIDRRVALLDLEFDKLIRLARTERPYKPLPQYPAVSRDLSVLLDRDVSAQIVLDVLAKVGTPLLERTELFDRYSDDSLGKNKKSYAFHLWFRAADRTLKEADVQKVFERITKELAAKKIAVRE